MAICNSPNYLFIDFLRSLACVLVVIIHSPYSSEYSDGFWMASATLLGLPCNGLFFMVSGYLLLPIKEDTFVFLKKRFLKVILPTLFWTFFYIFVGLVFYNELDTKELCRIILSIPFSCQGTGWLWFMYVMIGLYLLSPIISSWINNVSRRVFGFYIVLCLITSFFPFLSNWLEVSEGTNNMLYYFSGYIGYFLLGAFFRKYPVQFNILTIISLYFIPIIIAFLSRILGWENVSLEFCSYLSFFTVSMCMSIFLLFMKFENAALNKLICVGLVKELSKCSFGIYLIHHFVNHQIIDREFLIIHYGTLPQIVISAILTLVIAFAASYAISWLPYAQYIIGYKHKK